MMILGEGKSWGSGASLCNVYANYGEAPNLRQRKGLAGPAWEPNTDYASRVRIETKSRRSQPLIGGPYPDTGAKKTVAG